MNPRNLLTATEVDDLLGGLEGRLHTMGIQSQPAIAAKVIALAANPDAGLRQYAEIVRADASLAGRLLRLANSAFFAQRQPVTSLDRACVLLGLERLKAVSLGFQLSRAAAAGKANDLSRRIWGEGVYRACLAAEISRSVCPGFASEAFVIGLIMDCGIPILCDLLGPEAEAIFDEGTPPQLQFRLEFESLPFTHVDVATALARRWRLPDLLARPIERHHTPPQPGGRSEPVHLLHRVAYYVGALRLDNADKPRQPAALAQTAENTLGLNAAELGRIVTRAGQEYGAISEMFRDVAQSVGDIESMSDRIHGQLVEMLDQVLMTQIAAESQQAGSSFMVAEQRIEIEGGHTGVAIAYLVDATGARLLSYAFRPGVETAGTILDALGLDEVGASDTTELDAYLRSLAA